MPADKPHSPFPVQRRYVDISFEGSAHHACHLTPENMAKDAPTLVFLHEGLGSIVLWKDFPDELCARTNLPGFVYDRLGYGKSTGRPPEPRQIDYLHHEARVVLPEILSAAGSEKLSAAGIEKPILIGHSDGGSIALLYASAFPDQLLGACIEAAHVFVEDVTLQGIEEAVGAWKTTNLRDKLARYHGDNVDGAFAGWSETWLQHDFKFWNIEADLPAITAPFLVIQGEDDEYGTARQVEAICRQSGGPATPLMLPDCAHIPHFQAREEVLSAMETFIQQHLYAPV